MHPEIIERLTRLEEGQKTLIQRFDALEQRVDALDKRMDSLDQRMNELMTTMLACCSVTC